MEEKFPKWEDSGIQLISSSSEYTCVSLGKKRAVLNEKMYEFSPFLFFQKWKFKTLSWSLNTYFCSYNHSSSERRKSFQTCAARRIISGATILHPSDPQTISILFLLCAPLWGRDPSTWQAARTVHTEFVCRCCPSHLRIPRTQNTWPEYVLGLLNSRTQILSKKN